MGVMIMLQVLRNSLLLKLQPFRSCNESNILKAASMETKKLTIGQGETTAWFQFDAKYFLMSKETFKSNQNHHWILLSPDYSLSSLQG